jgi:hypothetical protein
MQMEQKRLKKEREKMEKRMFVKPHYGPEDTTKEEKLDIKRRKTHTVR